MAIGQWAPTAADENTTPWLLAKTPPLTTHTKGTRREHAGDTKEGNALTLARADRAIEGKRDAWHDSYLIHGSSYRLCSQK